MWIDRQVTVLPAMHDQPEIDSGFGCAQMHRIGEKIADIKGHPGALVHFLVPITCACLVRLGNRPFGSTVTTRA